jgi:hypothetical protein
MGLDKEGGLRCVGSNAIPMPTKSTAPLAADFFKSYDDLRLPTDRAGLIHQAVCVAAKSHADWIDAVCAEGQRYRTMPIFLVVLDGDRHHFYATTCLVDGPRQTNTKLVTTQKVTL